jgi:hypothetical protein
VVFLAIRLRFVITLTNNKEQKNNYYIGMDLGANGAIAMLDDTGASPVVVDCQKLPVIKMGHRSVMLGVVDAMFNQLRWKELSPPCIYVLIEAVDAMPHTAENGNSYVPASDFQFGVTVGCQLAAMSSMVELTAKNFTLPQQWKKAMKLTGQGKDASIVRAKALYPRIAIPRHDIADALCLAYLCKQINQLK